VEGSRILMGKYFLIASTERKREGGMGKRGGKSLRGTERRIEKGLR